MKVKMKIKSEKQGVGSFTLIELMAVVAVIAILAGLVMQGVSRSAWPWEGRSGGRLKGAGGREASWFEGAKV